MAGCEHNIDMGFDYPCMACDPTPDDPKLHSIGFAFVGGQDMFHGDYGTLREQQAEMFANAKKYGNPEPEYVGKRSKMRSLKEIAAEIPAPAPGAVEARLSASPLHAVAS